ncbi:hypothetical protein [Pollutibacter soli]|uniref:bestrophin-like domain n=1 Tax=Pollutibacter soli TaxID=3034157 RepID=UPI003013F0BE
MKPSIFYNIDPAILCGILFAGCILMVIAGKVTRNKFLKKDESDSPGGAGPLLGALFGLWGFVLAITFGNASSRFENFRAVMIDEANSIRNAILRSETLSDSMQTSFNDELKRYLELRIEYYNKSQDLSESAKLQQEGAEVGVRLWRMVTDLSKQPGYGPAGAALLATLTNMFDIAARRDALLVTGVPLPISVMLFSLALFVSFLGGFTSPMLKTKDWVVIAGFILLACIIIYITIDLARPTAGFIAVDSGEDKIVQLLTLFDK